MATQKIAYVVLHYNTIEDTKKCVNSIRAISQSPIVIVCNGSHNDSDVETEKYYADKSDISVIVNEKNVGFAAGNNIGIQYVRDKKIADLIVCVNNDVIFEDMNFEQVVVDEFETTNFGVGGVDVRNPYGVHCNPRFESFPTQATVDKSIRKFERAVKRCKYFGGIGEILYVLAQRYLKLKSRVKQEDMIMTLHGCCVVFTPAFFSCFQGMCEDTFLYGEEIILSYLCHKKGVELKYINSTGVLHNESKATKAEYHDVIRRHRFYYENILESTKALKELL